VKGLGWVATELDAQLTLHLEVAGWEDAQNQPGEEYRQC